MKGNKLEGRPGQIFNMDESGMPLDPKARLGLYFRREAVLVPWVLVTNL